MKNVMTIVMEIESCKDPVACYIDCIKVIDSFLSQSGELPAPPPVGPEGSCHKAE